MNWEVITGDCLIEMPRLMERGQIFDACITDIPYGTTACAWDTVIPFEPMWASLKRLVKRNGATVLFGSQPFTSALVMSNPQMFKFYLVWEKTRKVGFLNATKQPLREHEDISVFCGGNLTYNPQGTKPCNILMDRGSAEGTGACYGNATPRYVQTTTNYPTSIVKFPSEIATHHPTQKPVELMRYLVRTYTNEGDAVLDFTCGSGSTGVACAIENRNFIGIEKDEHYAEVARARISRACGVWAEIPKRIKESKDERFYPLFAVNE